MYRKNSMKINILLIFSCLLYLGFEFGIYYLTDSAIAVFSVAILGSLLLTHIFLEASLTYEVCFLLTTFSVIPASLISLLIYFKQTGNLLIYHDFLPYLILLHWLLPLGYSTFRCLFDRGPRFVRYNSFFVKTGLLFAIYYVPTLIIRSFILPLDFPYTFTGEEISLIPFMATATHIEDFIYTGMGIGSLLLYSLEIFLLFLPIGFYGSILLKEASVLSRLLLYLVLPFGIEGIIWLLKETFMIDACLFRFLSIVLGVLLYQLINYLFQMYTREDFLYERSRYSFF